MTQFGDGAGREPGKDLQQAFDQAAGGLGLRLEPRFAGADDTIAIGMAVAGFSRTVDVKVSLTSAPVDAGDDDSIREVLQGYESLDPTIYPDRWREFATDPHMGVGLSWVGLVNEHAVQHWLETKALADAIEAYPPFSPRRIQFNDLKIMYIGNSRAVATYGIEEEFANGKRTVGNYACILFRVDNVGWRIVVATKGGVAELFGQGR